jgi:hypothetical protein
MTTRPYGLMVTFLKQTVVNLSEIERAIGRNPDPPAGIGPYKFVFAKKADAEKAFKWFKDKYGDDVRIESKEVKATITEKG